MRGVGSLTGPTTLPSVARRRVGGKWDGQRWLIHVRRIGLVLRVVRRVTDPLFRQAGLELDPR